MRNNLLLCVLENICHHQNASGVYMRHQLRGLIAMIERKRLTISN